MFSYARDKHSDSCRHILPLSSKSQTFWGSLNWAIPGRLQQLVVPVPFSSFKECLKTLWFYAGYERPLHNWRVANKLSTRYSFRRDLMDLCWRGLCRTRIKTGKDDVLTGIDALMGWRWGSPTRKRGVGCSGIGPQGYMVHWSASSVCRSGSGTPKLARALNCGWISCFFATRISYAPVSDDATRCRFRNVLVQGGVHDDHGPQRCKVPPPRPGSHFSADTQVRWSRTA